MASVLRLLRPAAAPRAAHRLLYSTARPGASGAGIQAAALQTLLTSSPKPLVPKEDLVFGHTFTDHMLAVEWTARDGWHRPQIKPYGPLQLDPSCSVFHYAFECFEGLKAYRDAQGKIRLFRPDMNMARMNDSAARLYLPQFDGAEMIECIKELLRVDQRWVPDGRGYSLYLRPTLIATENTLGVHRANSALLYVIMSPCGPYFRTGFKAVSLYCDETNVRAWPGGVGNRKLGANYAPSIGPQAEAESKGYQQVLWTIGKDHELMEVGTMNMFVYWRNEQGELELVTPPLDGTILPGVTRASILELARGWGQFKVSERTISMTQVAKASNEGRLLEMFGAGTACVVTPVRCVHFRGTDYRVPLDPANPDSQAGPVTARIYETLLAIQYGDTPSKWSILQLVVIFGTMHIVKRAGLEAPEYVPMIRAAYAVATAAILALTFHLKSLIQKRNDTTALEYDDPTPGSQNARIVTTACKYDLGEVAKLQKSTLLTVAIVASMHKFGGYTQPLILQTLLPALNMYKNPLFQIHVLGRPATDSLKRPWIPENPFAALTGQNNNAASAAAAAATAVPASEDSAPASPSGSSTSTSETRKDR
ncbi:branched-chain-amino-acid transaminase bat2 [Coemansia javaensis]|uniref:Branched-chain-amino-acid aminotransferase n=1 Tax=Coemansia javaensis TaxID=2761396 RepID=A0A9W8HB18_9FUNG|nr:branched-chain-amino-acid transaminase bat2 [Coemansia javaensis]